MWRLVLIAALLLPLAVEAKSDRGVAWSEYKRVPVWDHTGGAWDGDLAIAVSDFNTAMPKGVPALVYRSAPAVPCPNIKRKRRGIVVCFDPGADGGMVTIAPAAKNDGYRRIVIEVNPSIRVWMESATGAFCHELMHAVTGVGHPANQRELLPSCVLGTETTPGSWDVAFAKRVYAKRKHR